MRIIVGWLVLIWLLVGAFAGFQRGHFSGNNSNCSKVGTIAVTVVAGPLNYFGVNPKVNDCPKPPKPSR
ncbi:MAG TPA: hypothetical protein VFD59_18065 [Nocardioidaceae bacterium]|nr:hypothetical protein [Nocardioidaceae bacterium]